MGQSSSSLGNNRPRRSQRDQNSSSPSRSSPRSSPAPLNNTRHHSRSLAARLSPGITRQSLRSRASSSRLRQLRSSLPRSLSRWTDQNSQQSVDPPMSINPSIIERANTTTTPLESDRMQTDEPSRPNISNAVATTPQTQTESPSTASTLPPNNTSPPTASPAASIASVTAAAIADNISAFFNNAPGFINSERGDRPRRLGSRRLFHLGGSWDHFANLATSIGSNSRQPPQRNGLDEQSNMLSQLLSVAAAATAASLTRHRDGSSPGQAQIRANGQDNGFDQFLSLLHRGRLMAALRGDRPEDSDAETGVSEMPTSNGPQMNMFRMFRFGTITAGQGTDAEPPRELVPIIIVGIRSVTPREVEQELGVQNAETEGTPEASAMEVDPVEATTANTGDGSVVDGHQQPGASVAPSTAATSGNEPMPESTSSRQSQSRSWIIYVVGGTYPSNHPILTTPSLFTDNPSYEDMLMLDMLAQVRPPVTTQAALDKSAEVKVITVGDLMSEIPEARKCQICLSEYEDDDAAEKLRILSCRHVFHKACVDKWLTEGANKCPLCRDVAIKTRAAATAAVATAASNNTVDGNDTMQGVEEHR